MYCDKGPRSPIPLDEGKVLESPEQSNGAWVLGVRPGVWSLIVQGSGQIP